MSPAQKWNMHIDHQTQSGMTQVEYCRKNNLHPVSFSQWKRRLREQSQQSGFVALDLPPVASIQTSTDKTFRVCLANGLELVLPMNIGQQQLVTFISALKGL